MEIGAEYNPKRLFFGAFVPDWLLCRAEITAGAKLCWAALARRVADDGTCEPNGAEVAAEIGISVRQFWDYLGQLQDAGLVMMEDTRLTFLFGIEGDTVMG